ncbi:MAG: citramalate synthase [Dehalococcoidales bacterium]|nr:citramalate synthase [Dehalococcoidales bacterium]
MGKIYLYDTTLRDGSQKEGVSFSVVDKLEIARRLDDMGIDYIEGGWPGSNPKDAEFFQKVKGLDLKNAKIVVFGSTRRANTRTEKDNNLLVIVETGLKHACLVGKSSEQQVKQVLETTPSENLAMIAGSILYLKDKGMTVFFDAEHFFDGFKSNPEYSLQCLKTAAKAGADFLVLCDTNGGALPEEVAQAVKAAKKATAIPIGIHAHNDGEVAVANTLDAVKAGVTLIEGTINGYGERCGNANLCSIVPNLKLKMGINCISSAQLAKLTEVSRFVSEAANLTPDASLPYVGSSAFSHKAGYHVSGVTKWMDAYQHIDPAKVGNRQNIVVSELSGKGNIIYKAKERGLKVPAHGKEAKRLLEQIKLQESRGFQYENADASFDLLVHRAQPGYKPPFELVDFMVVVEKRRRTSTRKSDGEMLSEAMVKVKVDGKLMHTAAGGNGPVNALDTALRKALLQFYPALKVVKLIDYKVRILAESTGTGSQVRVLIESSDGTEEWRTVGSSTDIIEASWLALADGLEYWLLKHNHKK